MDLALIAILAAPAFAFVAVGVAWFGSVALLLALIELADRLHTWWQHRQANKARWRAMDDARRAKRG